MYQTHTSDLHNVICQLHLSKAGREGQSGETREKTIKIVFIFKTFSSCWKMGNGVVSVGAWELYYCEPSKWKMQAVLRVPRPDPWPCLFSVLVLSAPMCQDTDFTQGFWRKGKKQNIYMHTKFNIQNQMKKLHRSLHRFPSCLAPTWGPPSTQECMSVFTVLGDPSMGKLGKP